jgi:hypothetical protein
MRVIVAGATAWNDVAAIRRELAKLPVETIIVHGDSPGADALAGQIATELGLLVEAMVKNKDDYAKYRRGAWKGLNERMLASGALRVLAFHPAIADSHGTKHLVAIARAKGIEVQVFTA